MADIRLIRRQIRGVQSIARITRAMEMVAASKMKRAQEHGLAGRPYAEKIRQVIADLAALTEADRVLHPLLERRPVNKVAIVHITPDRGLCGGLVANLNRTTASFILEQSVPVTLIGIGRKGLDFMRRYGRDIRAEFTGLGDQPSLLDTLPISRIIIDGEQNVDYIYEPGSAAVLDQLLPRFVEMQVYQAIVESIASEQSARMVAMRNATDNASELIQDLTLMYNKARQESITRELLDITGGAEALA